MAKGWTWGRGQPARDSTAVWLEARRVAHLQWQGLVREPSDSILSQSTGGRLFPDPGDTGTQDGTAHLAPSSQEVLGGLGSGCSAFPLHSPAPSPRAHWFCQQVFLELMV